MVGSGLRIDGVGRWHKIAVVFVVGRGKVERRETRFEEVLVAAIDIEFL